MAILNLQALRKKKGITQKALAEALGVSASLISMYEKSRREPGLDMLLAMSAFFAVSLDDLVLPGQLPEPDPLKAAFDKCKEW